LIILFHFFFSIIHIYNDKITQGRNLEGLQKDDVRIILNDIECPVVEITPTSLKCDLTKAIDEHQILERGMALEAKVAVR
jgi:hypothetical protein